MSDRAALLACVFLSVTVGGCEGEEEVPVLRFEQTEQWSHSCTQLTGTYAVHDGERLLAPLEPGVVDLTNGVTYDFGYEADTFVSLHVVEGVGERVVLAHTMGQGAGGALETWLGVLEEGGSVRTLASSRDTRPIQTPEAQRLVLLGLYSVAVLDEPFALTRYSYRSGVMVFDAASLERARTGGCTGEECVVRPTVVGQSPGEIDGGTIMSLVLGDDGTDCWTYLPPVAHPLRRVACGRCDDAFVCTPEGDSAEVNAGFVLDVIDERAALIGGGGRLNLWSSHETTPFVDPTRDDIVLQRSRLRFRRDGSAVLVESGARYADSYAIVRVDAGGRVRWARTTGRSAGEHLVVFTPDGMGLLTMEPSGGSCRQAFHYAG